MGLGKVRGLASLSCPLLHRFLVCPLTLRKTNEKQTKNRLLHRLLTFLNQLFWLLTYTKVRLQRLSRVLFFWQERGLICRTAVGYRAQTHTWSKSKPSTSHVFIQFHKIASLRLGLCSHQYIPTRKAIRHFCIYGRPSCKRPPKMQRLSGRLQESNHRAPLPRGGPGTSTLWKMIYCMQFLSYTTCSYTLSFKFFIYSNMSSIEYAANIDIREYTNWSLTRD